MTTTFDRYGPWALVAGGAQGIGAAFSQGAASLGLNIIVIDNCHDALDGFTRTMAKTCDVECLGIRLDLSKPDMLDIITTAVGDREVGLVVYNAALADVGPFYKKDTGLEFEKKRIAINVTGPMVLSYHFGKSMLARKSGGIILMSSGAGLQGSPYYAHYSATKAYDIALAEALWGEFKPYNVDVLACVAGMTLSTSEAGYKHLDTSTFQTTDELVDEAFGALGNQPTLIAGEHNRQNRKMLQNADREELIGMMSQHAIDSFLGGEVPEQNI